jgi:hypothetical protein
MIPYRMGNDLVWIPWIALYTDSTLGKRRPLAVGL